MTDPSAASDQDLIRLARGGDQRAFTVLVGRHKHWLYRFVRRYVGDSQDAQDVLQDSLVSALTHLARYDPERSFETWLRRIALNKCRDRARRLAVRRAIGLGRPSGEAEVDDIVDPSAPADAAMAAAQTLRALDRAIALLPAGLKAPLVLTALEGLSHKEAGELLGLSDKAVEVRVYRAKRRLAAELDRSSLDDVIEFQASD